MRKIILFATTALLVIGCSSTTPVTLQSVANDISAIDTGLNNAVKNSAVLAAFPGSKIPVAVSTALADLDVVAKAAAAAPDAAAMKGNVTIVENDVNAIIAAIGTLPLPAPYPAAIAAVEVLLPAIEAAVGVAVPTPPPAPVVAAARMTLTK